MRVLIDMDGVCADFTAAFTRLACEMGACKVPWATKDQKAWEFPFEMDRVWEACTAQMNWWMTLPSLLSDAEIACLNEAIAKHDVYFVTNRKRTAGLNADIQTRHWLESVGVHVNQRANVIATKAGSKGKLARALDIDIGIDDKVSNLTELAQEGIHAVARRWEYNKVWSPAVATLGHFLRDHVG